jgi:hypothetical protein
MMFFFSFVGFHNVPNTVLYELFTTLQAEWTLGIKVGSIKGTVA